MNPVSESDPLENQSVSEVQVCLCHSIMKEESKDRLFFKTAIQGDKKLREGSLKAFFWTFAQTHTCQT